MTSSSMNGLRPERDVEADPSRRASEGVDDDDDVVLISSPFNITQTKNVPIEILQRWRQATLVLNTSRRFRYTLDLKEEEEKENMRRMIRSHAQVIRAAALFKLAAEQSTAILQVILGRILVMSNVIFEILAATFEQLSSPNHSVFALLAMVTSFTAFVVCIIEIVYRCNQGKVKWRKRGQICWWFYPSNKCFGSFKVSVGLACALCQWVNGTINYIQYRHHHDNPIKLSIVSVVFALVLCGSTFFKDRDEVEDEVEGGQNPDPGA